MFNETKELTSANQLKNSLHCSDLHDKECVLEHKLHDSPALGHEVGFQQALADWIIQHRSRKNPQIHCPDSLSSASFSAQSSGRC